MPNSIIRRAVLRGVGAAALTSFCVPVASAAQAVWPLTSSHTGIDQRHLWVRQAGRDEELHVAFRSPSAVAQKLDLDALRWMFRDWRDKDAGARIDIRLFDLLATIQTLASRDAGRPLPLILNSGYRTQRRNAKISGAAKDSQHIHGRAADFVLGSIPPSRIAKIADASAAPGLGRYPTFTHVDVGPAGRRW